MHWQDRGARCGHGVACGPWQEGGSPEQKRSRVWGYCVRVRVRPTWSVVCRASAGREIVNEPDRWYGLGELAVSAAALVLTDRASRVGVGFVQMQVRSRHSLDWSLLRESAHPVVRPVVHELPRAQKHATPHLHGARVGGRSGTVDAQTRNTNMISPYVGECTSIARIPRSRASLRSGSDF